MSNQQTPRGVTVRLIGHPDDVATLIESWPQVALTGRKPARDGSGVIQYGVVMFDAAGRLLTPRVTGGA